MGLERVLDVRHALALVPRYPMFTVGGTNGKGSCCAMLEAILLTAIQPDNRREEKGLPDLPPPTSDLRPPTSDLRLHASLQMRRRPARS